MSCSLKTSPGVPIELNLRLRPTKPSSGSAHNSQFPSRPISQPPNPAPPPAARSPRRSFLSPPSLRSRFPSSPRRHPPIPQPRPPTRCPPPKRSASPNSLQPSQLPRRSSPLLPLLPLIPLPPRPTPAATFASRKKSFHPRETAKSPHRSTHKPARAPPSIPPPHEIPSSRSASSIAPAPLGF